MAIALATEVVGCQRVHADYVDAGCRQCVAPSHRRKRASMLFADSRSSQRTQVMIGSLPREDKLSLTLPVSAARSWTPANPGRRPEIAGRFDPHPWNAPAKGIAAHVRKTPARPLSGMTSANLAGGKCPARPARVASAEQCGRIWSYTPIPGSSAADKYTAPTAELRRP